VTRQAVQETQNKILRYNQLPAHTVFTSNCGGYSQDGKEVGWGDVPYWKSLYEGRTALDVPPASPWELRRWLEEKPNLYCDTTSWGSPAQFRWSSLIFPEDLQAKFKGKQSIGEILSIVPLERSQSGNVRSLLVTGTKGQRIYNREHEIRGFLGLQSLRSTQFVVETIQKNGKPYVFLVFGGGWGHGVGLCQSGAAGRALAGQTYDKILGFYYPGTQLSDW
jgi:SpoIID/LytB domain protein